ncbi:MAG TPA: hypothetical protein VMF88_05420 [Bacteroidota bacterium]|nr:hypothetical protein [Bacteroidota bacterium]
MKIYKKEINVSAKRYIVGFDVEWTKNYHAKHGNKPFCFSFVYVDDREDLSFPDTKLDFGFFSYYIDKVSEAEFLCKAANKCAQIFLTSPNNIFVGHQFSSDLAVLLSYRKNLKLTHLASIRSKWRSRHEDWKRREGEIEVFDTRYDLPIRGKSHRLVDVCQEWRLNVTQPELKGSMTRMQNDFYTSRSELIKEKLTVLNLRHSLSSILLYLLFSKGHNLQNSINVNKIIFNNVSCLFSYVKGDEFKELL